METYYINIRAAYYRARTFLEAINKDIKHIKNEDMHKWKASLNQKYERNTIISMIQKVNYFLKRSGIDDLKLNPPKNKKRNKTILFR